MSESGFRQFEGSTPFGCTQLVDSVVAEVPVALDAVGSVSLTFPQPGLDLYLQAATTDLSTVAFTGGLRVEP